METPIEQPKMQSGIIGLFDILGYRSFLQNNTDKQADFEQVTGKVVSFLANVGEATKVGIRAQSDKTMEQLAYSQDQAARMNGGVQRSLNEIKWLSFSDTLLVTIETPEKDDESKQRRWFTFLDFCSDFCRHMFEYGLPVRGAIDVGKYIVKEKCFAGRPIVSAYDLANDLDVAATVFTEEARKEYEGLFDERSTFAVEYLIPRKKTMAEKLLTLDFVNMPKGRFSPLGDDLRQKVAECFWAHKKDVSPREHSKLHNTEMLLRFFKARRLQDPYLSS